MYWDNHIATAETALINETAESFSWESVTYFEEYINQAISRVRNVKNVAESRSEFIKFAGDRLETGSAKKTATHLCARVFESDSDFSEAEKATSAQIAKTLS